MPKKLRMSRRTVLLIVVLAMSIPAFLPVHAQEGANPFDQAQRDIAALGGDMWRLGVTVLLIVSALLFLVAAGGTISGILTGSSRAVIWGLAAVFGAAAVLLVIGGIARNLIEAAGQNLARPPSFLP